MGGSEGWLKVLCCSLPWTSRLCPRQRWSPKVAPKLLFHAPRKLPGELGETRQIAFRGVYGRNRPPSGTPGRTRIMVRNEVLVTVSDVGASAGFRRYRSAWGRPLGSPGGSQLREAPGGGSWPGAAWVPRGTGAQKVVASGWGSVGRMGLSWLLPPADLRLRHVWVLWHTLEGQMSKRVRRARIWSRDSVHGLSAAVGRRELIGTLAAVFLPFCVCICSHLFMCGTVCPSTQCHFADLSVCVCISAPKVFTRSDAACSECFRSGVQTVCSRGAMRAPCERL